MYLYIFTIFKFLVSPPRPDYSTLWQFLVTFVISLMKSIDIRSESAIKLLAEFLDMDTQYVAGDRHVNAEHFAHGPSRVLSAAPILGFGTHPLLLFFFSS